MLFSPSIANDNSLVIVPPKPDAILLQQDEFSFGSLYSYGGDYQPSVVTVETSLSSMRVSSPAATPAAVSPSSSMVKDVSTGSDMCADELENVNSFASSDDVSTRRNSANSLLLQRDPRNGAFTFQVHAEYDLLLHVQKDLDRYNQKVRRNSFTALSSDVTAELEPARIIMKSIDNYCLRKQWMYHIGFEKAVVIRNFLQRSLHDFIVRHSDELYNGHVQKFIAVDLGTYCGYSALVMCHAIRSLLVELEATGDPRAKYVTFEVITTEVSSKLINVAQSMFRLGKMDRFVAPIMVKDGDVLSEVIKNHFSAANDNVSSASTKINFLLLDHSKTIYLSDLNDLETNGLLGTGSYVSADNVIFNRLDSYRDHMATLAREGVVETRLEEMNLEYSNNLKDGIGELLLL
jgi:predicted O-methyltransferase YrrM